MTGFLAIMEKNTTEASSLLKVQLFLQEATLKNGKIWCRSVWVKQQHAHTHTLNMESLTWDSVKVEYVY